MPSPAHIEESVQAEDFVGAYWGELKVILNHTIYVRNAETSELRFTSNNPSFLMSTHTGRGFGLPGGGFHCSRFVAGLECSRSAAEGPLAGGVDGGSAGFADSAASASLSWIRLVSSFCRSGVTKV